MSDFIRAQAGTVLKPQSGWAQTQMFDNCTASSTLNARSDSFGSPFSSGVSSRLPEGPVPIEKRRLHSRT